MIINQQFLQQVVVQVSEINVFAIIFGVVVSIFHLYVDLITLPLSASHPITMIGFIILVVVVHVVGGIVILFSLPPILATGVKAGYQIDILLDKLVYLYQRLNTRLGTVTSEGMVSSDENEAEGSD